MSKASKIGQTGASGSVGFDGELIFLAFPMASYRALAEKAAEQNKSLAQALQDAVETYLRKSG